MFGQIAAGRRSQDTPPPQPPLRKGLVMTDVMHREMNDLRGNVERN